MAHSQGSPEIAVALIDGPVVLTHPDLASATIRVIPGNPNGICTRFAAHACAHATFVAGILSSRRGSGAPAICPDCTLLVRPIYTETPDGERMPMATPGQLAEAIIDCTGAGARVINLSSAMVQPSTSGERELEEAINYSARRSVLIVAAAGNQGTVGTSVITRHSWVIPVAACNEQGRPLNESNLGGSIGMWGLSAPGENITSLGTNGKMQKFGGTSAAAPFVTGTIALLWSRFPSASAARIKLAVTQAGMPRRRTIAPPLLDAWAAFQAMEAADNRRAMA
jgi:subtilisin family serine protease